MTCALARRLARSVVLATCWAAIGGGGEAFAQALSVGSADNPQRLQPLGPVAPGTPLFERRDGVLPYGLSDTAWASPDPTRRLAAEDLARMHQAMGASIARVPVFWPQVEPEPGARDWRIYDELYRALVRHGVRPLWTLYQSPRHVVGTLEQRRCRGVYCDDEPAADRLGALTAFSRDLAARFPLSAAFEYRNEPNVSRDVPRPLIAPDRYVAGLRAFHRGIKDGREGSRVLGLALAIDRDFQAYLAAALRAGAAQAMDGLSFHPYWVDARPDTLALVFSDLHEVLVAQGAADLRLVPDEAGASTTPEKSGIVFDEGGQRDRMLAWFRALDARDPALPLVGQVDAAVMFTTVDGTAAEGFGGYGWFTRLQDGVHQPRPVFCAFREQVAGLATFKGAGPLGACPGDFPGRAATKARKRVRRSCPSRRSRSGKVCRCRTVVLVVKGKRRKGRRCGYVKVRRARSAVAPGSRPGAR